MTTTQRANVWRQLELRKRWMLKNTTVCPAGLDYRFIASRHGVSQWDLIAVWAQVWSDELRDRGCT